MRHTTLRSLAANHAARTHPRYAMPRADALTRIYYVRDRQQPGERRLLRPIRQDTCPTRAQGPNGDTQFHVVTTLAYIAL